MTVIKDVGFTNQSHTRICINYTIILHSLKLWSIIIIKCAFFVNGIILKSMKNSSKRRFGLWINK